MPKGLLHAAVLGAALVANAAQAAPLALDGQWSAFDVDDFSAVSGGLEWIGLDGQPLSFDFTLVAPAVLRVVDAGEYSGDRFAVFDGATALGESSPGAAGGHLTLLTDFDGAFADHGHFSYSEVLLGAGEHHITGMLVESARDEFGSPLNATVGAVSLSAPVPLPTPALLLGSAAVLLGLRPRCRQV